jgi:hypothetical protein
LWFKTGGLVQKSKRELFMRLINYNKEELFQYPGLNGTGKSNILDSICFLLGISNLKNVRAENLQDLVYKNGQA